MCPCILADKKASKKWPRDRDRDEQDAEAGVPLGDRINVPKILARAKVCMCLQIQFSLAHIDKHVYMRSPISIHVHPLYSCIPCTHPPRCMHISICMSDVPMCI